MAHSSVATLSSVLTSLTSGFKNTRVRQSDMAMHRCGVGVCACSCMDYVYMCSNFVHDLQHKNKVRLRCLAEASTGNKNASAGL